MIGNDNRAQHRRRRALVRAGLATALAVTVRAPLGLRPPPLWSGLRLGGAAAGVVTAGVAAAAALPRVRAAMADRALPATPAQWLALEIPLGTVWAEEMVFRGVLTTLAADRLGPAGGRLLQSVVFGLSHLPDARSAGDPVLGTALVTGVAGWVFGWLAGRSGSLIAPLLAHLAVNEAGAVAAVLVQRSALR